MTWVPVSPRRLRQRGYDQARLLAESACRLWETKPLPLLRKTVHNPAQSGLKEAAARRANVLGVYEAVDPERISGASYPAGGRHLHHRRHLGRVRPGAAGGRSGRRGLRRSGPDAAGEGQREKGLNRWKLFTN